jgi:uncharacterized protein
MGKDLDDAWEKLKKQKEEDYYARRSGDPTQWLRLKDAEEERRQVRQVCHMRCPSCGQKLDEHSLEGGILQFCPECGGLWLERSEAEHLARREGATVLAQWLAEMQKKKG